MIHFVMIIEPTTVGCISASSAVTVTATTATAAGDLFSSSHNLQPGKPSALSMVQFTASALTSATSVTHRDPMTDILSFNEPGAFIQLYGFTHLDPPPNKVGWSFEFYIKTDSHNAILVYATSVNIDDPIDFSSSPLHTNKQQSSSSGKHENQFISIEVINGKPALSIDDGEGIVNVHSDIFISDGLWHHINGVFAPSHLELTVDRNARTVKQATSVLSDRISTSAQSLHYLDLSSIYLGGVDKAIEPVILQQQVQTVYLNGLDDSSLVGCIREVKINRKVLEEKQIKLTHGTSKGPKCKWEFICAVDNPCIQEAHCLQSGFDDFNCVCESNICVRENFTRNSLHKEQRPTVFATPSSTTTSSHKVNHDQSSHRQKHPTYASSSSSSSSSPSFSSSSSSFPGGANGNLASSLPRREDEKAQDVTVGGKKTSKGLQVSDLPAGQSHINAHKTNPGNAWGSGHQSNLDPGLSSSLAHSTPSLDPSASLASASAPSLSSSSSSTSSSSSSSFPELPGHFTVGRSNERSTNGNGNILQGSGHITPSQNVIDSLHNMNQVNSVGGFASNAFNFVISKEQLLIVTVIIAVTIVIVLFSAVIRAFYLLGKKSECRNSSKNSTRSNNSSTSSSSCSSPAQLMKDNDNSCILPLTSTTTGSTSVAGSSSGGTSSSPLPFGSDCGYDHHSHLDSSTGHALNYNSNHLTRDTITLGLTTGITANNVNGTYGHVQQHSSHHHLNGGTTNHYHANSDHGSEMMNNHNLVMMMSRCSSASSLPSSPLPQPPDPLTTRSQFLTYTSNTNSYYNNNNNNNSQSNTCDQIQLHPYPHGHHHQQHHHQASGATSLLFPRRSEGDTKGTVTSQQSSSLPPPPHVDMESSESSHLLMPATGMNLSISSPLSVQVTNSSSGSNNTHNVPSEEDNTCSTSSPLGVTTGCNSGNVTGQIMLSYNSHQNGYSDHRHHHHHHHHVSGVSGSLVNDAVVSLNYPDSFDKRHLARYSTYGTVSSNKKSPNTINGSTNYTTDDIMDAYATYSRVDKNRNKNTCDNSTGNSQQQGHSNQYNRQHRLSISSPSSSSTSSASPYTPNTSNNNSNNSNGETIAITTNRRDSTFIYPLPPPSLFFSRQQQPNSNTNASSPLLQDHNLTSTFKWS